MPAGPDDQAGMGRLIFWEPKLGRGLSDRPHPDPKAHTPAVRSGTTPYFSAPFG